MKTPTNVAIVGAGIGQKHLAAFLQLPDEFNVVALCDIDQKRAVAVLAEENAEGIEVTDDFDRLLKRSDVDLVDICLPPHLHFSFSMKALDARKHVICEKPLTSSLEEADLLIHKANESGCTVFPVFQYRYGPGLAQLMALIDNGFAGKPLMASVETHWNRDAEYYSNPWRGTWKGENGGAVLGHAIHNHDLLCKVFGPIDKLHAFGATRVNDIETEDCASISFQMSNGALATSSITLGANDDITRFRFCFEHLTAESDLLPYEPANGDWKFSVRGDAFTQNEINACMSTTPREKDSFEGFLQQVSLALGGEKNSAVSLADGRRSIELVTAIYDSMRTERVVSLPLDERHSLYGGWLLG